jgi:hypothetical protein
MTDGYQENRDGQLVMKEWNAKRREVYVDFGNIPTQEEADRECVKILKKIQRVRKSGKCTGRQFFGLEVEDLPEVTFLPGRELSPEILKNILHGDIVCRWPSHQDLTERT